MTATNADNAINALLAQARVETADAAPPLPVIVAHDTGSEEPAGGRIFRLAVEIRYPAVDAYDILPRHQAALTAARNLAEWVKAVDSVGTRGRDADNRPIVVQSIGGMTWYKGNPMTVEAHTDPSDIHATAVLTLSVVDRYPTGQYIADTEGWQP